MTQITLDSVAPLSAPSDSVVNEKIELIPRFPIHRKVSIKERVAPLKLKFEFFEVQDPTKKIKNPDCVIYLSPTV